MCPTATRGVLTVPWAGPPEAEGTEVEIGPAAPQGMVGRGSDVNLRL